MSNILSYTISSEHECFEQAMLYEHIFLIISYTWRNSYFFNNIGRVEAVAHSARSISSWRTGFSDAEVRPLPTGQTPTGWDDQFAVAHT